MAAVMGADVDTLLLTVVPLLDPLGEEVLIFNGVSVGSVGLHSL